MQSMPTLIRLLVTVLTIPLIPSACNARKQLFSGSHSFNQDDEPKQHQQQRSNVSTRQYSVSAVDTSDKGIISLQSFLSACPSKNVSETKGWGVQSCGVACIKDEDCSGKEGFKCTCDGSCGLTCNKVDDDKDYCGFPGRIDNGRVLVVGKFGLYDYRNQLKRFRHNQKIIFECDRGFALSHGPTGKTCRNGVWLPAADIPQCIESDGPAFRWIRSTRKKRRAIKTGGGTFARTKGGGGGGGDRGSGTGRRTNRIKGRRPEDGEITYAPMSCPSLDHDEFMQVEVIKNGEDVNNTYSVGAIAKISCTPGYWVNLNNETVVCEKGKWKPKLPQCSALPCRVPYIIHGTFYVGSKPLFFEELKPHSVRVELRCSKGFMVRGPSKLTCHYGEWNVDDTPECVPAGCRLPTLDRGIYLNNYKAEMVVESGTEVEYTCIEEFKKASDSSKSGTKCEQGEWNPATPKCISSALFGQRNMSDNYMSYMSTRKSCGSPPKDELAITYNEGIPLDFKKHHKFPHGTEVMYRCVIVRPRAKNRWKIVCDDGKWIKLPNNVTCEGNITDEDLQLSHNVTHLINSSCVYKKVDKHVVTFYNDQELVEDQLEFPFKTLLISRCVDIGKFQLKSGRKRQCISGQWMGLTPRCEGLSQYHDYAVDKSPTILFRFVNGSISQTVNGELVVYPGTTLHMECLYLRKFGRPSWEVSHDHTTYAEGWTDGVAHRDATLEYRLTIENASDKDSGIYSCSTPTRHSHEIKIIVKKVDCLPLPLSNREDLTYSTTSTMAGIRVKFECKNNNVLIGNKEIQCQASGTWNGVVPRCEVVECPDIQTIPAMSPLAFTEVTRNGTLRKNETAPPTIKIESRAVGGKVNYSCPQGFAVEGSPVATCLANGKWSDDMPLCKEVECTSLFEIKNGHVTGHPPYKAGDHAQIDCANGFLLEGQSMITCQDDGKWSRHSKITKCVPACTYPGTTIGATISDLKIYYPIGEIVEYGCTDGYKLVGERVLKCLSTAKWSHPVPNCKPTGGGDSRSSRY